MEEIGDMLSRYYEGQERGKSGSNPTPFLAFGPGIGPPERSFIWWYAITMEKARSGGPKFLGFLLLSFHPTHVTIENV